MPAAFIFCCGCAARFFWLWVRPELAIAWFCASAAGAGLGNPIGHGLRKGLCGAGGGGVYCFAAGLVAVAWAAGVGLGNPIEYWPYGVRRGLCGTGPGGAFIFLLRVRGGFFLLWVRPCPGLGRSGGIQWGVGRPAGGCVFFAAGCCRCAALFFFGCGCAASSLTHLLPAASEHPLQKGIQGPRRVYFFLLRVRELWGGAFIFLLRVCGAFVFFLLLVRGAFFFAVGARQVHSLTRCRPPPSIHCRKTSRVRGAFILLLRVRELTHSLTRCPPPGEHQQQKSTHKKKHGFHDILPRFQQHGDFFRLQVASVIKCSRQRPRCVHA